MPLRLALVLLFLGPTILAAPIALGPERAVTEPGRVIANGSQRHAQVATSGSETLVAWIDDTPGRWGAYIAALADDGTRIEGTQRLLSADASRVLLTWTGESYLAFWQDSSSIEAMTLDGERRPLSPPRTVLHHSSRFTSNIVWIGGRGAVMSGRELFLVDRQGNVIRQGFDVNPGGMVVGDRVATDGQSFFVFWHAWVDQPDGSEMTDIFVRRFKATGEARDAAPTLVVRGPRLSEEWDVAFGGNRFALVTAEPHGHGEATLRPILLDPATLQSTPLAPMRMPMGSQTRVEWVGDRFVALWFRLRDDDGFTRMQTLAFTAEGTAGAVVDHAPIFGVGDESSEAWNGRTLVVAFTIRPFGFEGDVYAAVAWREEGSHTPSVVALSPAWQGMPAVATNGQQSLIVWTEGFIDRAPDGLLRGRLRLAAAHATAGVADHPTVYLTESAYAARPSVVFTGTRYLVTWIELVENELVPYVMMQRFDTDGALIDAEPIALSRGFSAAMAWNGTHVIVGWGSLIGLLAARLTPDGEPFDTQAFSLTGHVVVQDLVAASNGSDFLFVWPEGNDGHFPLPGLLDLHAARVDAAGTSSGTIAIATGPANQRSPVVASDGRDFLIAYVEDERLVTKKVLREGTLDGTSAADAGRAVDTTGLPMTPTLAATGNGYVLAWESVASEESSEVFIAGVDRSGAVNDAATMVARSELGGMWPIVATAGSTLGDIAYTVLQNDDAYGGAPRLFLRRLGQGHARGRSARH